MARKRKAKKDRQVTVHMTIPPKLAARIDKMLEDLRAQAPYQSVTRSALVSYLIAEWFALIDDPHTAPTTKAEVRKRMRKSNLKNSHVGVNGNATLTPKKVLVIRRDKRSNDKIARAMGVHNSTICRVKNRETWGWVRDAEGGPG